MSAKSTKSKRKPSVVGATRSDDGFFKQFQAIGKIFDIEQQTPVQSFLFVHADLLPLLKEVHKALRRIFPDEHLHLDLVEDPNEPEGTELRVKVRVAGAPSIELHRLEQFDQDWWHHNRQHVDRRLCVDLRFE